MFGSSSYADKNRQTQENDNPFQPINVMKRTLYQRNKKKEVFQETFFPWGQSKGGAGDPFKDENGNVITNRKAAI
jgi:hypothetical protein